MARDVAVVGFAQRQTAHFDGSPSMVELLVPIFGELWEQKGDASRAIEYYGKFVRLWKNADAEFQPTVEDIRRRIARLDRRVPR